MPSIAQFLLGLLLLLCWTSPRAALISRSRILSRGTQQKGSETALFNQLGRVTMYKKQGCPHCTQAINLLQNQYELRIDFVDVEEPDVMKRDEILQQMRTFSGGRNTVPQVFFNSEHLGGNDDIQKFEAAGQLAGKVENVKAIPVSMMMDHWYHPWY